MENPYHQHSTVETFLQHRPLIDPSSLTLWRKRIGEGRGGVEANPDDPGWAERRCYRRGERKARGRRYRRRSENAGGAPFSGRVVMENTIAYLTDGRLYERARDQLVTLAQKAGVELRQSFAQLAPRLAPQVGRYAYAKQFKRMRKALKKVKRYTGWVMRDLRRQLDYIMDTVLRDRSIAKLALVRQLLHQQPKGADKTYALHEPDVGCISKG